MQVQAPGAAYIWKGDLTEVFLHYGFGGLISGGAYTWRDSFSEFYGSFKLVKMTQGLLATARSKDKL